MQVTTRQDAWLENSPRRTVLDTLLVDAARAAGAEVRERTIVDEVLVPDGSVAAIRCRTKGSSPVIERAPLVVGAEGKHSIVASTMNAARYRSRTARSVGIMDPITGQGMGHALRDAQLISESMASGKSLAHYAQTRRFFGALGERSR